MREGVREGVAGLACGVHLLGRAEARCRRVPAARLVQGVGVGVFFAEFGSIVPMAASSGGGVYVGSGAVIAPR